MAATVLITANVLLVLVTAFYAWQTKRLTDASIETAGLAKESTQAARDAAQAAIRSASAAIADTTISFKVSPSYTIWPDQEWPDLSVRVINAGSTVYVHRAVLHEAWIGVSYAALKNLDPEDVSDIGPAMLPWVRTDTEIVLEDEEAGKPEMPVRFHNGDALEFVVLDMSVPPTGIASLDVSLWYSLDGQEVHERRARFTGVAERDYSITDIAILDKHNKGDDAT